MYFWHLSYIHTYTAITIYNMTGSHCNTIIISHYHTLQITIPLARFISDENKIKPIFIAADLFTALHFIMDPYLYVLQHHTLVKSICLTRETRKSSTAGAAVATVSTQSWWVAENREKKNKILITLQVTSGVSRRGGGRPYLLTSMI